MAIAVGFWLLLAAFGFEAADAAPAAPDMGTTHQPDGTAFASRVFGDEWANGVETATGYTVVKNRATGVWEYAARAPGNRLRASGRVVGRDAPGALPKHLRDEVALAQGADLAEAAPLPDPVTLEPAAAPGAQTVGASVTTHRNLVILASFNDQASLGTTPAAWSDRFFGASGSLSDYYQEVSYGAFSIEPATETSGTANDGVVDWVALDMPHPNGDMEAARRMVKAAVEAADATVDFAPFDTDGNGILVPSEMHITVIAAGYEGSFHTVPGNKVWGHRWSLQPGVVEPPVADGVSVANMYYGGGYTAFGEMHNDHQATVGIVAHEFGHDIGLPDLYDTDRSSSGVGKWSVMGSGSWLQTGAGHQGSTPAHADAWSKWYQGWVTPNLVTTTTVAQPVNAASSLTNSDVALQLGANPNGPTDWKLNYDTGNGEYFLVENRQRTAGTFDAGLPGDGLLVWHVNESSRDNATDSDRLVDLVEADGLDQLDLNDPLGQYRGDAGDPYPGSAINRSVSSTTTPDTRLNTTAALSGVTIEAISDSGPTMTADIHVPTANDTFAAATAMTDRFSTRSERITEATRESGEPTSCGVDRSVWFKYTAPESATIALSTAGTPFDTALGVFTGSTVADLTAVACNRDATGVTTSALSFAATAGTTYYVQAGNDLGAPGGVGDLTLSMQSSPTAPLNPSASRGNASATVTWDAPLSDGGSPITGYTVTASPGGATATSGASTGEAMVTGLTNGTAYTFTVTATNAVGEGPASAASAAVTPVTVPTAPLDVWATATEGTTIVGWTPSSSDGGAPITGYTVTALPGGNTTAVPAGATETTIAGLTSGTAYTFTVTATNGAGEGPASIASAPATPLAHVSPVVAMTAPTGRFTLTNTVIAKWTATDGSGVAAHDVRWRRAKAGRSFEPWVYNPAWQGQTILKAALAGTQPGYTYCFSARSTDTVGNTSDWATARCTTTPLDDRAMTASSGWTAKASTAYYRGTYQLTKLRGSKLTSPTLITKDLRVIATRCPGCGRIKVTIGAKVVTIDLDTATTTGTTTRKALIPITTYTTAKSVKVIVTVVSTGKPVQIDGLASATG